jgi:hypothetical protein
MLALELGGIIALIFLPVLGQTKQFSLWHLDERKHLAALADQHVICWTRDLESTPEPHALHPV